MAGIVAYGQTVRYMSCWYDTNGSHAKQWYYSADCKLSLIPESPIISDGNRSPLMKITQIFSVSKVLEIGCGGQQALTSYPL
jgi:hypothetical protein